MVSKTPGETWPPAADIKTGLAAIDDEYQQLLQLISQAQLLIGQKASTSQLLTQARDLIVCTACHFKREENFMQTIKYPALEATIAAQNTLIQNLQDDFNTRAFNPESIGEFIDLLKDSLVAHIATPDKNFTTLSNSLNEKIKTALRNTPPLTAIDTIDIYILDDEQQHVDLMVEMIAIAGLSSRGFTSAKIFIDHPISNNDIILLDLNMPDMDGIEVMRTLYDKGFTPTYILASGFDERVLHSAKQFADAKNIRVAKTLSKPINTKKFIHYISQLNLETRVDLIKTLAPINNASQNTTELSLEQLKTAIEQRHLRLFYQPKQDISSGKTIGLEALVRLQQPELGLIFPDQFIDLAEQNNLISDLTNEVFRLATEDYLRFREAGINLVISINISAKDLLDLSMPERFAARAKEQDIPPEAITIELTETAVLKSVSDSLDILNRLRMKGFSLSIDDFGTGYSSLVQLYQAPFTELKIDQHFVMRILEDDEALSIVKMCILLAKELKMKSVAEGVETQEIWDKLKQLGCDLAQGYFMSKPIPVDDCCEWLAKNQT